MYSRCWYLTLTNSYTDIAMQHACLSLAHCQQWTERSSNQHSWSTTTIVSSSRHIWSSSMTAITSVQTLCPDMLNTVLCVTWAASLDRGSHYDARQQRLFFFLLFSVTRPALFCSNLFHLPFGLAKKLDMLRIVDASFAICMRFASSLASFARFFANSFGSKRCLFCPMLGCDKLS